MENVLLALEEQFKQRVFVQYKLEEKEKSLIVMDVVRERWIWVLLQSVISAR